MKYFLFLFLFFSLKAMELPKPEITIDPTYQPNFGTFDQKFSHHKSLFTDSDIGRLDTIKRANESNLLFTVFWNTFLVSICTYGIIVQKPMPIIMAFFATITNGAVQGVYSLYMKIKINQIINNR